MYMLKSIKASPKLELAITSGNVLYGLPGETVEDIQLEEKIDTDTPDEPPSIPTPPEDEISKIIGPIMSQLESERAPSLRHGPPVGAFVFRAPVRVPGVPVAAVPCECFFANLQPFCP